MASSVILQDQVSEISARYLNLYTGAIADILDKHGAPPIIDYGAFDIEGSEMEVFETFPFSRYVFRALSVECDTSGKRLARLLAASGYREVTNPFNRNRPWERYWLHREHAE